jgi:hypothetical protein
MQRNTHTATPAARLINVLIRALAPGEEPSVEAELLKHFPFARVGVQAPARPSLRIPTTVSGAL